MARRMIESSLYLLLICVAWLVVVFPAGLTESFLKQVLGDNLALVGHTVTGLAALVTVLLFTHLFARRTFNMGLSEMGLGFTGRTWLLLGTGTAIGTAGLTVVFLAGLAFGHLVVVGIDFWSVLNRVFVLCVIVAVTEEVIFRGYLLQSLGRVFSDPLAVLLASLIYVVPYFGVFSVSPAQPILFYLGLFALGLVLATAYYISQSLWLPIGIHFSWNLTEHLLGFTGRTGETAVLLVTRVDGPAWLVGSLGTQGSVFGYLGIGLMFILLFALRHKLKAPPLRARISSIR